MTYKTETDDYLEHLFCIHGESMAGAISGMYNWIRNQGKHNDKHEFTGEEVRDALYSMVESHGIPEELIQ